MLQGLFVAAETILNTIVLPPAIDDAGGAGSGNDDYTQVRPRTYFSNTPVRVARFGGQVVVLGLGCLIKIILHPECNGGSRVLYKYSPVKGYRAKLFEI